jgi:hypothetical protein
MDSNTNSLVEQRFVSGYYDYWITPEGKAYQNAQTFGLVSGVRVLTNLKPAILLELPNDIFKTHSQIWSWAQRVKLLEQSGSAKPYRSKSVKSVNRGD